LTSTWLLVAVSVASPFSDLRYQVSAIGFSPDSVAVDRGIRVRSTASRDSSNVHS
jgi:hypothetical protein